MLVLVSYRDFKLHISHPNHFNKCLYVGACRAYYNDKQLNGLKIDGFEVSANLDDDDIILSFYSRTTGWTHGWVVFKTKTGKIFKCHLVGIPGKLFIRVQPTEWKSDGYQVKIDLNSYEFFLFLFFLS
jgi:hypothetical protein